MSKRNKRNRATLERVQQQYPQGGTVIPNALIQQFMAQIQQQSKQQQGQNSFSPGKPLDPQNVNPGGLPIAFRYPIAYNTSGLDRTLGNPDIPPFQQLRNLADLYEGIQLCEKVWLDLIPRLQLKITLRPELVSDTETDDTYQKEIAAYQTFFEKPDGVNDLHSWLRIAITEQLQLDALYIHKQKTRGKQLQALNIVAGDTMKVLLDDWGRVLGYQQFPWGIPGEVFLPQDMLYFRESPRANTPYGKSRVERILMRVNQALRKEKKDLAYFTEGNIPHAIMEVPETSQWTPDQIEAFEAMWNSLIAGNVQQQVRVKFTQPGMKYTPLEQYQLLSDFDQFILNIATAAYGISLADLSFTGDIHKSSDDGQQNMLGRRTIYPIVGMYGMLLTNVLREDFKDPRFVVTFTGFEEAEDTNAQSETYSRLTQAGILGLSNAAKLMKLPEDPKAPHIGRVVLTKDGPIFLDDMATDVMRNAAAKAKLTQLQQSGTVQGQQQLAQAQLGGGTSQGTEGEQETNEKAPQKTSTQSGKESDTGGQAENRVLAGDDGQADRDSYPMENGKRIDDGHHRSIYDDLRKWRTRALDDVKVGRSFRPFVSTCIPQERYTALQTELQRCTNVEDVRALFARAKGGAYGPGEWQNTDKEIQQQLATLQAQGVTQVRWQTTVGACDTCTINDQEVRPLGQPFLSGAILPPHHPNCVCTVVPVHDDGLQRYNENHDARGRFATGGGSDSGSGSGGGGASRAAQLRALEQQMAAKHPLTHFDFTGCDPAVIGPACEHLDMLMQKYPDIASTLAYVGTGNGAPQGWGADWNKHGASFGYTMAYTSGPRAYSVMHLNPAFFGDPARASQAIQQGVGTGWLASGASTGGTNYIMAHEFGHVVHGYLKTAGSIASTKKGGSVSAQLSAFESANFAAGNQVSRYAAAGGLLEQFPEGFASLQFAHPSQQAPYTQNLGGFLDTILPKGRTKKWK